MTVAKQLLDLVVKNPHDPSARGVYADALIQAGDPRGTFIMLQTHLEGAMSPDKREAAKRQVDLLLRGHKAQWMRAASPWAETRFKAGFVHAIRAKATDFSNHGAALLSVEPVVEITLTGVRDEDLVTLAKMPALSHVTRISLQGGFKDKGATALMQSPHVGMLRSLNISGARVGSSFAGAAGKLTGLVSLCLTGLEMGDVAIAPLARETPHLEHLYLARNDLTDAAAALLASGTGTTRLKRLCLGGNEITDEGAEALASGKSLACLELLELNQTSVSDDGAEALVKSRALKALRKLDLRSTEVGDAPSRKNLKVRL